MKVAFVTLGCKLNQFETEGIAGAFKHSGWTITGDTKDADLIIINTCAVTSKAEQKARRLIRQCLKSNAKARVIVTGCYAQLNKAEIEALGGEREKGEGRREEGEESEEQGAGSRVVVVSAREKALLLDWPVCGEDGVSPRESEKIQPAFLFNPADFSFHSRAFLKIQDGCDNACAYCAVRLARGRSVSLDASEALARLRSLEEAGFNEAVLTGVNIAQYRAIDGGGLAALLATLLGGTKKIALRLSSLEPDIFDNALFEALRPPRIRPHFHLSVQSASEKILAAMGRRYTAGRLLDIIARLRTVKNDPFLACDIITGFPGESEAEFEKTLIFCEKADFAWIHAFPFSPRPNTAALALAGKVSERDAVLRVEKLTALAKNGRERYIGRNCGRIVSAIRTSGATSGANGTKIIPDFIPALTENYLRAYIAPHGSGLCPENREEFLCKITAPQNGAPRIDVLGELVSNPPDAYLF
jgi:threonylcarbamoyladenosine tRNA methylthiotransferase MtaB